MFCCCNYGFVKLQKLLLRERFIILSKGTVTLLREPGSSVSIKARSASITAQATRLVDYTSRLGSISQRTELLLDDFAVTFQFQGWLNINILQVFLKSCVNEQFRSLTYRNYQDLCAKRNLVSITQAAIINSRPQRVSSLSGLK